MLIPAQASLEGAFVQNSVDDEAWCRDGWHRFARTPETIIRYEVATSSALQYLHHGARC